MHSSWDMNLIPMIKQIGSSCSNTYDRQPTENSFRFENVRIRYHGRQVFAIPNSSFDYSNLHNRQSRLNITEVPGYQTRKTSINQRDIVWEINQIFQIYRFSIYEGSFSGLSWKSLPGLITYHIVGIRIRPIDGVVHNFPFYRF